MRRLLVTYLAICGLLFGTWQTAQSGIMTLLGVGPPTVGAAAYSGPGDIVSGAIGYWGFRGYNAAYAGKAANICLPLDVMCADVSILAGNFNLSTIGGTACNNSTTICTVKTLYDQSGALDCAGGTACDITNATIANRPVLVISAVNGKTCAQFTGSGSQVLTAASVNNGHSQPFTLIGFAERTAAFSSAGVTLHSSSISVFFDAANTWGMFGGSATLDAAATDSAFHSLINVFNGASSSNVVDGSATTPGANPGTGGIGSGPWLLGNDGAGDFLTAVFCEAGAWPSGFNSTQYGNMNTNQSSYF